MSGLGWGSVRWKSAWMREVWMEGRTAQGGRAEICAVTEAARAVTRVRRVRQAIVYLRLPIERY